MNLFRDYKIYESKKRNLDDYKDFQIDISVDLNSKKCKSKLRNFRKVDNIEIKLIN